MRSRKKTSHGKKSHEKVTVGLVQKSLGRKSTTMINVLDFRRLHRSRRREMMRHESAPAPLSSPLPTSSSPSSAATLPTAISNSFAQSLPSDWLTSLLTLPARERNAARARECFGLHVRRGLPLVFMGRAVPDQQRECARHCWGIQVHAHAHAQTHSHQQTSQHASSILMCLCV